MKKKISMNKFGFLPGQFTMEAIFLLRRLMAKYREACKELYMVFFNLFIDR